MKFSLLNAGSSSQECCLYEIADAELPSRIPPLWEAETDGDKLKVSTSAVQSIEKTIAAESAADAISHLLETLWSDPTAVLRDKSEIDIVGHHVVHGGRDFRVPTCVDGEVKAAIRELSPLAPAHNPAAPSGIEAVEELLGDVPQVAVFDTAFHATLPA